MCRTESPPTRKFIEFSRDQVKIVWKADRHLNIQCAQIGEWNGAAVRMHLLEIKDIDTLVGLKPC